jgi:hypothetical protein
MTYTDDKLSDLKKTARDEFDDARARLSGAAEKVKAEAMQAGSNISSLVMDELDRRMADIGRGLRAATDRIRDPSTDSGEPPRMVTQALDMVDDLSIRIESQSARDLADRLSQFGRSNSALFLLGCFAVGLCAGRVAVAQGSSETFSSYRRDDPDMDLGGEDQEMPSGGSGLYQGQAQDPFSGQYKGGADV